MSTTTRRKSAAYQHHQAYRGAGGAPIKVKVHTFVPAAATSGGRSFGKKKKRGRRLSVAANFALQSAMGKEAVSTLALTAATAVGLFKLNTQGDGITRTVKSLWKA